MSNSSKLKEEIINIPNKIRSSMRMTDQKLDQLKQLL